MPRAEAGSTKALNNKMKSKGLQRLRWYCQVCERQMRDENGFKCHTQSEAHVRQMLVVGENSKKFISDYSKQFQRDFLLLLRTSHGEKKININHFYQEYIANKEHVHMNATRWPSLTEFAKFLGREGICRVEEGDKGLEVAWIDSSPEALRRQDAIRKKERQDRGDEEREQKLIKQQIERARIAAEEKGEEGFDEEDRLLKREDGEKIKLSFGTKQTQTTALPSPPSSTEATTTTDPLAKSKEITDSKEDIKTDGQTEQAEATPTQLEKAPMKIGFGSKPKNVFATVSKKNAFGGAKSMKAIPQQKPMSEAERIMKEELERKRRREESGMSNGLSFKKQKV